MTYNCSTKRWRGILPVEQITASDRVRCSVFCPNRIRDGQTPRRDVRFPGHPQSRHCRTMHGQWRHTAPDDTPDVVPGQ